MKRTVCSEECATALIYGARGSGKSMLVESALCQLDIGLDDIGEEGVSTLLSRKRKRKELPKPRFEVVRLNGTLHGDERTAVRAILEQLGQDDQSDEEDEEDGLFKGKGRKRMSFPEEAQEVIQVLKVKYLSFFLTIFPKIFSIHFWMSGWLLLDKNIFHFIHNPKKIAIYMAEKSYIILQKRKKMGRTSVFILDEFHLFAQEKQRQFLLYMILDAMHEKEVCICFIGIDQIGEDMLTLPYLVSARGWVAKRFYTMFLWISTTCRYHCAAKCYCSSRKTCEIPF